MKDKYLNLNEIEDSHTLGGGGRSCTRESEVERVSWKCVSVHSDR
jgi:hypothetical protein